jgi:AsmA family/AsmA-like C-terminal region
MAGRVARRAMWATLLLVVLAALLLPPFINVNRYRKRVADSTSRALGREVSVSNIELKLLPRPGLVLSNFVVAEDPSYGAEPMLRAATVTAYIRITSLWRGRLEIGTLDLDSPSLNLVRRSDGHWNLEELVERTAQVASAPTTKTRPEARPRFPYVEATAGRINFKLGQVKKAFAFTDADFALWLDSESQWGIRLNGHPMRTDVGISDTGILKLDGRFERGSALRNTPLNFKLTWAAGPLGQITGLIFGHDRGWRGILSSSATLTGTPEALGITLDAQVDDFRRYDIALGEALRLRVHCTGSYSSPDDALHNLQCESPVGQGILGVRGNVQGWLGEAYDLGISAEQLPAERLVALARHAKKDLPADLSATGDVEAVFTVRKLQGGAPIWGGGGRGQQLALHAAVLTTDLDIGEVHFVVPSTSSTAKSKPSAHADAPSFSPGSGKRVNSKVQPAGSGMLHLVVEPFPLSLGAVSPATASATFDPQHYSISLSGEAELARLLNVGKALGVGTPGVGLAGPARVDLEVAGTWVGFAPPVPSGKIQLGAATAELQGVSEPLHILSATAALVNQAVNVTAFTATFAQGPEISGSATFPVHCTAPETCVVHFDARTDDVSLSRLNRLVNPSLGTQPWYRLLAPWQRRQDALLKLRASGRFTAARMEIGPAVANNVSGTAELSDGKLRVSDLRADLLAGHHTGTWTADFTVSPPRFAGSGNVTRVSMLQVASLMHDNWAAGTLDAKYSLAMAGLTAASLRDSTSGSAVFSWQGGVLRHVALDLRGAPVSFSDFAGTVSLQNGILNLADCKLQSTGGSYEVKGTASFDRNLDLRFEHVGGRTYAISGPLEKPRVEALPPPPSAEATLR